ncbi:hypothetical protein [Nocardia sp. NPDC059691]|uniref:hypothetical protein n=1 Tax=Nocardia sp. NPDC059691 TaxID=3346908 RepID=UPI0036911BBC
MDKHFFLRHRQVAGWMTQHPDNLTHADRVELDRILARSELLTSTSQHVCECADMSPIVGRIGQVS